MKKISKPILLSCVIAAGILVLTAIRLQQNHVDVVEEFDVSSVLPPPVSQPASPSKVVTATELATNDGTNGKPCFVAVDGTAYEITQGKLWNNGQHDTSGGQAMCGKDLSEAMKASPHGKSKLTELSVIGQYQP